MSRGNQLSEAKTEEPILYKYCIMVYDAMSEQAEPPPEDMDYQFPIWRGFLTHLFNDLEIGITRYSRVIAMLQAMRSIDQIKRGTNKSPSVWSVVERPTLAGFEHVKGVEHRGTKPSSKTLEIEQRLKDQQLQINELFDEVKKLKGGVTHTTL